ncbi:uncharacterized protein V2V93DRAFT_359717 [Kockiozyma suomiensis]|uniref:uncharacterized protein n=1 Tax=Kockiozyma suomiensis TaxID=1337062 RepID=UPI003343C34C
MPPTSNETQVEVEEQVVTRADRQKCWDARDRFFACLKKNNIQSIRNSESQKLVSDKCADAGEELKKSCRQTWVDHFILRREKEFETAAYKRRMSEMAMEDGQSQAPTIRRR